MRAPTPYAARLYSQHEALQTYTSAKYEACNLIKKKWYELSMLQLLHQVSLATVEASGPFGPSCSNFPGCGLGREGDGVVFPIHLRSGSKPRSKLSAMDVSGSLKLPGLEEQPTANEDLARWGEDHCCRSAADTLISPCSDKQSPQILTSRCPQRRCPARFGSRFSLGVCPRSTLARA